MRRLSSIVAAAGASPPGDEKTGEPLGVDTSDMHQIGAAAMAMRSILIIAPDIDAFEAGTTDAPDIPAASPDTAEGRAALVAALRAMPADLLEEALRPAASSTG